MNNCITPPIHVQLSLPSQITSRKPNFFSTFEKYVLNNHEDEGCIFHDSYLDLVTSFTKVTHIPTGDILEFIICKILLQAKESYIALKAYNSLMRLLSMNALNYRNLLPSWEFITSLWTIIRPQIPPGTSIPSEANTDTKKSESMDISTGRALPSNNFNKSYVMYLFSFLLAYIEKDYNRYINNFRDSVAWKLLSPSIFGNFRLNDICNWLKDTMQVLSTKDKNSNCNAVKTPVIGQVIEDRKESTLVNKQGNSSFTNGISSFMNENSTFRNKDSSFTDENTSCPSRSHCLLYQLQRLLCIVYLVSRDPSDTATRLAQLQLEIFIELKELHARLKLIESIESVEVKLKTLQLVIDTMFESTTLSDFCEQNPLSLYKIVSCYFNKMPPKYAHNKPDDTAPLLRTPEEAEEFVIVLYHMMKTYCENHVNSLKESMSSLSLMTKDLTDITPVFPQKNLVAQDEEILSNIKQEVLMLRTSLEEITPSLSQRTELYLKLIIGFSESVLLSHRRSKLY